MNNLNLNKRWAAIVSLLFLVISVACTPTTVEPGNQPAQENTPAIPETNPLDGTDWDLISIGGIDYSENKVTLTFDNENVGGMDGCNHFGGQYSVDNGVLVFDNDTFATTEMACPDMETPAAFMEAFLTAGAFSLENDRLTIQSDHGELIFVVPTSASLEDTKWQLSGMAQNDAIMHMAIDQNIYFQIENGAIGGTGGCNTFGGDISIESNDISISHLFSTLMACLDEDVNQREQAFFNILENAASYEILRQSLTLFDADGQLLATFSAMADGKEEKLNVKTFYVGAEQVDCVGVGPQKCLLIKENIEDEYTFFYDNISGFEWEAGFEYELLVSVTDVENPPADASSLSYELIEVVSKITVDSTTSLSGTKWSLFQLIVGGDAVAPAPKDTDIFFQIDEERITGSSGCNSFNGAAMTADNNGLSFGPLVTTRKACAEELMNFESGILEQMAQVASYQLNGRSLELFNADGLILAKFTAVSE